MKKIGLILIIYLFAFSSYAQRKDSGYTAGTILMNGGFSFGDFYYDYGYQSAFPALVGNVEISVNDLFAFGPYIGIHPYKYGSIFSLGGRGTFHFSGLINRIDPEAFDLYGSMHIGVNFRNYDNGDDVRDKGRKNLVFGPVVGGRWFPSQSAFGLFGEVGYGPLGLLTIGVSGRF